MDQNGLSFLNYASVASHLAISKPKLKIKRKKFTKNDVTVLKLNGLLGQYREGLFMNFSWYRPRLKE